MTITPVVHTIDTANITEWCRQPGPWLTLTLPTHRHGPMIRQDMVVFEQLLELSAAAGAYGEQLAESIRAWMADSYDWQYSTDGLVIAAQGDKVATVRVEHSLPRRALLSSAPWLRPLVPTLARREHEILILAISTNRVRLVRTTRHHSTELDLGPISSASDLPLDRDHQSHLQFATGGSQGTGGRATATFHGHGGGSTGRDLLQEKFFRHVTEALASLGLDDFPLLIAGVREHRDRLVRLLPGHRILPEVLSGNPDNLSLSHLVHEAWTLLDEATPSPDSDDDSGQPDRRLHQAPEIAQAGLAGRVETLRLSPVEADDGQLGWVEDELTEAAAQVLLTGGRLEEGQRDVAILRW